MQAEEEEWLSFDNSSDVGNQSENERVDRFRLSKFPESLVDVDYLLKLNTKSAILPNFGGEKENAASFECVEKPTGFYQELENVLAEERVCRKGSLSSGRWDSVKKLIVIDTAVGPFWHKFGTKFGGLFYALPEEALFLVEQGVFELFWNSLPLTVQEAWTLLLAHIPSLEYYSTFAFLCRQGFAIVSSRRYQYIDGWNQKGTGSSTHKVDRHAPREVDLMQNVVVDATPIVVDRAGYETLSSDNCLQAKARACSSSDAKEVKGDFVHDDRPKDCGDVVEMQTDDRSREYSADLAIERKQMEKSKADGVEATAEHQGVSPLVQPADAVSVEAVLSKLQIIRPRVAVPEKAPRSEATEANKEASIGGKKQQLPCLDLYYKSGGFKKSNPGPPDCRVFVYSFADLPPNQLELESIHESANGTPVKFAMYCHGSVTFYGMFNANVSTGLDPH